MKVGAVTQPPDVDGAGLRVAVARATFNEDITGGLLTGALEWMERVGVDQVTVVDVPGAFELPLVAQTLVTDHDAVVALGAVVLGDTDHYDHVAHRTSEGLMRVMLDSGVPVAFGVLTVRDADHAWARSRPDAHNKGAEAAEAAVRTAQLLRSLQEPSG